MNSLRGSLAALVVLGVFVSHPAFAQQQVEYPPACDESKVSRADHERAHTVFLSGKEYLEESNYDKAISYFVDAYSIDCSVHAMLPIIATAFERKGNKAEAIRALGEYLRRAPNAPDHEVIEHRIRNLREQLSREQPPPTPAPTAPTPTPPPTPPSPTPTAIPPPSTPPPEATSPEPTPASPVASAAAAPASSSAGPVPWILTGVGAAAVAAGVVLFIVGAGDISSATTACPNHVCSSTSSEQNASNQQSTGYTLENTGAVVGGAGLVAAVSGIVWGLVDGSAHKSNAKLTPVISPGYGGVTVVSSF